jgi:hypothetical protein
VNLTEMGWGDVSQDRDQLLLYGVSLVGGRSRTSKISKTCSGVSSFDVNSRDPLHGICKGEVA